MSTTLFADISEFQVPVNDSYPYQFISIRANDGTYRDHHFTQNLAWAKRAADSGKIAGFIVYFVWEYNWQQTVATLKSMVGTPHSKMAVMIDVENWQGKISGNQSAGINAARQQIIDWLGGNRKRVIGYANYYDFQALWPTRGDTNVVLANYSYDPAFSNKIIRQFSSSYYCAPFGPCDMNIFNGTPQQLAATLGLAQVEIPKPVYVKPASNIMVVGQILKRGQRIQSSDKTHSLNMQFDGNVVLYHGTKPLWNIGPGPTQFLAFQQDGNLVAYDANRKPVWNSGTEFRGGSWVAVQKDGNLVIYGNHNNPLWSTQTYGK